MPLLVNLRHLEADNINLEGEVPVEELDIDPRDQVIRVKQPLKYNLEVQRVEDGLLAQGELTLTLDCQCVRCLKEFQHKVKLEHWAEHLPLEGDDAVPVSSDCVDLTPLVREDILLEFPQHPLCNGESCGLPDAANDQTGSDRETREPGADSSAWAELNKLKL